MNDITYVGLDVHKTTICVAIAKSGRGGQLREVGVFENRPDVLRKMVARLGKHRRRPCQRRRRGRSLPAGCHPVSSLPCRTGFQATKTEKTNGKSTPPAITSFSPARSGASSPRK